MDRSELEGLDRESLVVSAQAAGIRRARILTRPELIDELLRLDPSTDEAQLKKSRGFFGKARDLVARVVERGLHLPDAAERIRTLALGTMPPSVQRTEPQAMPTVTLAEIYAAQGHPKRAIETLRRVLEREPDHTAARTLLARLEDEDYVAPPPPLPPEPDVEPEPVAEGPDTEPSADDEASTAARPSVVGPSYDDEGAEFVLAPASERDLSLLDGVPMDEVAPVVVSPPFAEVDAHADTAVHPVVPDVEEATECFAIPLPRDDHGGRTYVRWRVSFAAIGEQLAARPHGRFVIRAHVVTPSWDGPRSETRDRTVDPDVEEVTLLALPEPSIVRVAVGWVDGETFIPFTHSPALEITRGRTLGIWTTEGVVPVVQDPRDPRATSIASAFAASRRAAESRS